MLSQVFLHSFEYEVLCSLQVCAAAAAASQTLFPQRRYLLSIMRFERSLLPLIQRVRLLAHFLVFRAQPLQQLVEAPV